MCAISNSKNYFKAAETVYSKWKHLPKANSACIDIKSRGAYPANVLSNFSPTSFVFDGVQINSIEGFLQALKVKDPKLQRKICSLSGAQAKKLSKSLKQKSDDLLYFFDGQSFTRKSPQFKNLVSQLLEAQKTSYKNGFFKFKNFIVKSVNSFLFAIRSQDIIVQRRIACLPQELLHEHVKEISFKFAPRTLYWQGKVIKRDSPEYKALLGRLYQERFSKDKVFKDALLSTWNKTLIHSKGKNDVSETVLTSDEFIYNLDKLRKKNK